MDCKKMTSAVFVGEETAGRPNHYGEVKTFVLPGSGVRVSYSTKYFKLIDEDVSSLVPEVALETSFTEFIQGYDPPYEWIRKQ